MSIELRDGSQTDDPRLDRILAFDERSREYPVAEILPATFRSKTWRLNERNDQGREGACVGFGVGHRLAAEPIQVGGIDYGFSMSLYKGAQRRDWWEGEDYEGTSVLAGVQEAEAQGFIEEYRWCFKIEDYILALAHEGPVVVGTWWKDSMWRPDERGYLDTSGRNVGGHCYLLRGVDLRRRAFRVTNSWGKDWGLNGEAWIRFDDFERDLMPEGEGVVLLEKRRPRRPAPTSRPRLGHWWFNRPPFAR